MNENWIKVRAEMVASAKAAEARARHAAGQIANAGLALDAETTADGRAGRAARELSHRAEWATAEVLSGAAAAAVWWDVVAEMDAIEAFAGRPRDGLSGSAARQWEQCKASPELYLLRTIRLRETALTCVSRSGTSRSTSVIANVMQDERAAAYAKAVDSVRWLFKIDA